MGPISSFYCLDAVSNKLSSMAICRILPLWHSDHRPEGPEQSINVQLQEYHFPWLRSRLMPDSYMQLNLHLQNCIGVVCTKTMHLCHSSFHDQDLLHGAVISNCHRDPIKLVDRLQGDRTDFSREELVQTSNISQHQNTATLLIYLAHEHWQWCTGGSNCS